MKINWVRFISLIAVTGISGNLLFQALEPKVSMSLVIAACMVFGGVLGWFWKPVFIWEER